MKAKRGLTLLEVLLGVSLIAIALFVVITTVNREVIHNRRVRCQRNLNLLTKGMTTYIGEHDGGIYFQCPLGRGRTPNDYNGA